jgi:uncharacterized protein (UPF0303 family)
VTPDSPTPQPLTPDDVLAQEERFALPSFGNDEAVELGLIAVSLGRHRELPIVVEIRGLEQVLFRAALPGSSVVNDDWIARKTRLVERTGHATLYARLLHEAAGQTFTEHTGLSEQEYAAHGGGFPIQVRDVSGVGRVGVMVVSGLPHLDDHALVIECLEALLENHPDNHLENHPEGLQERS